MKKLILLLFLSGCGSDGFVASTASVIGVWQTNAITCNGETVITTGIESQAIFTSEHALFSDKNEDCNILYYYNYSINDSGEVDSFTYDRVSCGPDPCTLFYEANGASVDIECPNDFPVVVETTVTQTDPDEIIIDTGPCSVKYVRQ